MEIITYQMFAMGRGVIPSDISGSMRDLQLEPFN